MPIVKSEILEQSKQASGYRVKFKYTFADGRTFNVGTLNANDQAQINQLLIDKKAPLELSVKSNDAQEAKGLGIKIAYREASQSDVYFVYLYEGFNEKEPLLAYELMEPVAQDILDLGLTTEQMSVMFNQTVEMVGDVMAKWAYLDSNKDIITGYKVVKGGM